MTGGGVRSRTWTLARQPETLTAIQLSSGTSRSTWFRMSSPLRDSPKVPRPTPFLSRARRIRSVGTVTLPSTWKSQMKKDPRNSARAQPTRPVTRAWRCRKRRRK